MTDETTAAVETETQSTVQTDENYNTPQNWEQMIKYFANGDSENGAALYQKVTGKQYSGEYAYLYNQGNSNASSTQNTASSSNTNTDTDFEKLLGQIIMMAIVCEMAGHHHGCGAFAHECWNLNNNQKKMEERLGNPKDITAEQTRIDELQAEAAARQQKLENRIAQREELIKEAERAISDLKTEKKNTKEIEDKEKRKAEKQRIDEELQRAKVAKKQLEEAQKKDEKALKETNKEIKKLNKQEENLNNPKSPSKVGVHLGPDGIGVRVGSEKGVVGFRLGGGSDPHYSPNPLDILQRRRGPHGR